MRTRRSVFPLVSGTVHIFRTALALLSGFVGLPFFGTLPAMADLRVCNQTSNEISIALGYRVPNGWQSEGWWIAPPSQCATVFEGDLSALSRYFYIFAADDIGGGAWDGDFYLCTTDETFTIFGYENCLARGYERTGFFEVDTQNRSDWMLQLTDAENAGRPTEDVPDQTIVLDGGDQPAEGPDVEAPMEGDDTGAPMEGEVAPEDATEGGP